MGSIDTAWAKGALLGKHRADSRIVIYVFIHYHIVFPTHTCRPGGRPPWGHTPVSVASSPRARASSWVFQEPVRTTGGVGHHPISFPSPQACVPQENNSYFRVSKTGGFRAGTSWASHRHACPLTTFLLGCVDVSFLGGSLVPCSLWFLVA